MKTITLIFFVLTLGCIHASPKPVIFRQAINGDTTILQRIIDLPLSNYIGKPVDSLLRVLPGSAHTLKLTSADNPNIVSRLIVTYDNWYWVQIVVKKFHFMSPIDTNRSWDMELFKKEKISWIFVNRGNTCVYGCGSTRYRN